MTATITDLEHSRRKREVRVIPISAVNGASLSDIEDAETMANNIFADLSDALDRAFADCGTSLIGVAENIRENVEIGAFRTDDIAWRLKEAKNEAKAFLRDLRSDILGRLGKLGDAS